MIAKNYIFGRKYGANFLDGLVAYYPLNGNSNDIINGLNGINTDITYVTGNVNLGANFSNNTTSRITIADTDFLTFTDGINDIPFSMVFSIKQTLSGTNFIFTKFDNVGISKKEYVVFLFNNKIRFGVFTDVNNFLSSEVNKILDINIWYSVVCTYDGSKTFSGLKVYINGTLQTLTSLGIGIYTGMPNTATTPLIGNRVNNFANEAFSGVIDESYIYKDRVLSGLEVSEIYTKFLAQQPLI